MSSKSDRHRLLAFSFSAHHIILSIYLSSPRHALIRTAPQPGELFRVVKISDGLTSECFFKMLLMLGAWAKPRARTIFLPNRLSLSLAAFSRFLINFLDMQALSSVQRYLERKRTICCFCYMTLSLTSPSPRMSRNAVRTESERSVFCINSNCIVA